MGPNDVLRIVEWGIAVLAGATGALVGIISFVYRKEILNAEMVRFEFRRLSAAQEKEKVEAAHAHQGAS